LTYRHFPELGIPREERAGIETRADSDALLDRYERTTLTRELGAVSEVARLAREETSVLVCVEADPARCHRTRVARAVSRGTGLAARRVGSAA